MTRRRPGRRSRRRLGLRARIAVAVAVVCAAGTTTMGLVVYELQSDSATERFITSAEVGFDSDLQQARARVHSTSGNRIEQVVRFVDQRQGMEWAVYVFETGDQRFVPHQATYSTTDSDTVSVRSLKFAIPAWLAQRARTGETTSVAWRNQHGPVYLVAGLLEPGLVLVEQYSMRRLHDDLSTLRHTLAVVAGAVTAVSVLAAVVAAHFAQRPVRATAQAARRFGAGEFDVRLPVRGHDELAELAREFNDMAQRLGEVIGQLHVKDEQQRRFVADAAHDLRTPVATMVASVDSLRDPATRDTSADLLATQTRRLARLVEDLLEISRFDAGTAELRTDRIELPGLVDDAVSLLAPDADVRVSATGEVAVTADPRRLHTVIGNLVANALAHGAPPVSVEIDGTGPDAMLIRVADRGPGVPEDLLPVLFDRFTRGERGRGGDGTGLGLAIASANIAAHGGEITVANSGGAVFTVRLPRAPAEAAEAE
ncbi:sensor histidine kinase [Saccharomonospora piscinae]|uniref:sensor histidine kinase n=1 Tax=Saccharomonospora piscinae TaxID=687388 RepID=UPI000464B1E5|nr:HAMP domain-containing sensor histidine kinase [Saccharomonospora piscinae]